MIRETDNNQSECRKGLTVIVPFLNEGVEVENTVRNIRATSTGPLEIILINDASSDGYDYATVARRYGCTLVRHRQRKGVAASRDEGVNLIDTEYFILLDAHMEFYRAGWDGELIRVLEENPESILSCQTRVLDGERKVVERPVTYGAFLSTGGAKIECRWNYRDPRPGAPVVEVPVVLGGAYAARKDYWQHLHGLRGLAGYGMDEELISLKCWTEGGRCLLHKDIAAGHIYRKNFPYPVSSGVVLGNRLLVTELFFTGKKKEHILEKLRIYHGNSLFDRVYRDMDWEMISEEREYQQSIRRRDLTCFLQRNAECRI